MSSLADVLEAILVDLAAIKRRQDGQITQGTVHEVDAKAGTVRIKSGEDADGNPFLTPPIPYAQFMGALKVHSPPSVGQQMTVLNVAGDFSQGLAVPMTQSDANKSPSEKGDENVATYAGFKITLDGGKLQVTEGSLTFTIGGGKVAIKADVTIDGDVKINGNFDTEGSSFTNNGKDVGAEHKHSGVTPGGSNTGPPA
ncbi:phage baseplate assembly protein V [Kaistia sp. MMO-174]|uniref:phage baseplate assembly protein V n=1 Tax=Kaistia sp. MMO-174 TaxID=3081256 RepID=UPI0030197E9D